MCRVRGDGIMLALGPAEWRARGEKKQKEQSSSSSSAPGCASTRLPRHLIVRKVWAEPSGPRGSTAPLSAGQTERHSVLGPRLILSILSEALSREPGERGEKMPNYTHVTKMEGAQR